MLFFPPYFSATRNRGTSSICSQRRSVDGTQAPSKLAPYYPVSSLRLRLRLRLTTISEFQTTKFFISVFFTKIKEDQIVVVLSEDFGDSGTEHRRNQFHKKGHRRQTPLQLRLATFPGTSKEKQPSKTHNKHWTNNKHRQKSTTHRHTKTIKHYTHTHKYTYTYTNTAQNLFHSKTLLS